jgi:hypothetical protein
MTSNPQVTWLMPVRNGMPFLPLTLKSIAEQTYKNHKLIVWDNGSTDGTVEELRRWVPSRIPGIIVSERPMRLGPSLAAMVEMAETELCARIDADDINLPERLQLQVEFMQSHPEVGVLGAQLATIDERGIRHGIWRYATEDAEVRWRLRWESHLAHNAVLVRKHVILAAGNYRDCQPVEDLDLWMRVANIAEIRSLPDVLVEYRRTGTSSTGTISNYIPTDRQGAVRNAEILFPNLRDTRRAMALWDATHPRQLHAKSRVRHIWDLERAATSLAKTLGKPADYFTRTQLFQDQHYSLKKRAYDSFGLKPLVALKYRLTHAGASYA